MMRQRLAPSARRTAISLARAVPRASSMFARFKLAMSNTAAAMPMRRAPINVTGPSSSGPVLRLKRERLVNLQLARATGGIGWLQLGETLREHRQPRLGGFDRQAGLQTRDHIQRVTFRLRQVLEISRIAEGGFQL